MMPPGKIQVPRFCNDDSYDDVIRKGMKGLSIDSPVDQCRLLVSNGLIANEPLQDGRPWTLGNFITGVGGTQARSKRTFGICVFIIPPLEIISDDESVCYYVPSLTMNNYVYRNCLPRTW